MSQKITSKNLAYDATLPPFLARLRGQAAADSDGPDPLLVRNRRHAKPRSGSAEAEDAPLVVDDDGNVVQGLRVGVDGVVTETETEAGKETEGEGGAGEGGRTDGEKAGLDRPREDLKEKEKSAGIGGGKKRKVGKVVGADDDNEAGEPAAKTDVRKEDGKAKAATDRAAAAAKKKKAKKIKLSFGDDDG